MQKPILRNSEGVDRVQGGSYRESALDKALFITLSAIAMRRIARRNRFGANKYATKSEQAKWETSNKWEKGFPVSQLLDAAERHQNDYLLGDNEEDHLAAACWNLMVAMHIEVTKPKFQDIPTRKGLKCDEYSTHPTRKSDE